MATGDELNEEFLRVTGESAAAKVALWRILEDVRSSYEMAMQAIGVEWGLRDGVKREMDDYLANHYGV
jgi:hypothetical protein